MDRLGVHSRIHQILDFVSAMRGIFSDWIIESQPVKQDLVESFTGPHHFLQDVAAGFDCRIFPQLRSFR